MGKLEYLEMPVSDSLGEYFGVNAFDGAVAVTQTYGFTTSGFTTYLASKTYYIPANLKNVVITKSYSLGSYGRPSSYGAYSYWGYFENCTMLQEVTIRGIEEITAKAFFKCSNLKKVTLGAEVRAIRHSAFESCPDPILYFEGGSAQHQIVKNNVEYGNYFGGYVLL
jgi:hypothetical protein